MQELSQPVRDSKVICRSFCQKPWKRLHEQSHNSNQDLTKMAEAPYAPWRGTHGGCTYATRQSLEKASKEVVVITKCDHPPPSSFFFFSIVVKLAIQTMRCAVTLEETFTLQRTDEISIRLWGARKVCILERALIFLRLRRSLRDLFFFHFSLIFCRKR